MLCQVIGIAIDVTPLAVLELVPNVLGQIGDGDDALPLVVQDFPYVHIKACLINHSDIRRAVRRQDPAVAGAGNPARQVDLTALGVDVLHKQLIRGRIPIDLRHIVKELLLRVPLGAALVDFIHSTVLHNGCLVGRHPFRRSQLLLCHRGGIVLVTALDEAVHIDVRGGHIDVPPGDITRGLIGRCGTLV